MLKQRVKRETSLAKVSRKTGRPKATEPTARGGAHDTGDATLIPSPSAGQQRRVADTSLPVLGLTHQKTGVLSLKVFHRSAAPPAPEGCGFPPRRIL